MEHDYWGGTLRKQLLGPLVAGLMVAGAGSALADPGAETGEGVDQTCEFTDEEGNTWTEPCPTPEDPTADYEELGVFAGDLDAGAGGEQEGNGGGVFVRVGHEGQAGSLGRVGVSGDLDDQSVGVYAEDYTEGNQVANVVEDGNEATGCSLVAPEEGEECGTFGSDDSASDAAYVHN